MNFCKMEVKLRKGLLELIDIQVVNKKKDKVINSLAGGT